MSEKRQAIDASISAIRVHRMELVTYIAFHPKFRFALSPVAIEKENLYLNSRHSFYDTVK